MKKRVISIALSFCIMMTLFSVVPMSAFAAKNGITGDCNWVLNGTNLIISGNGEMGDYDFSNPPWGSLVKSVVIGDGVTKIGNNAFEAINALTSVTIEGNLLKIGNGSFKECRYLENFVIPKSVTEIGDFAFSGCERLKSINIEESITKIGEDAFKDCSNIKTTNITSLSAWCNIDFYNNYANPLFYSEKLYLNNKLLTALVIPDNIKAIKKYSFYFCSSLQSVKIPKSVTSIGKSAFYYCTSLKNVNIPSSVKSIGNDAFYGCGDLVSVTIPKSVTVIGKNAFKKCDKVTIYGNNKSYAQSYAEKNKLPFLVNNLKTPNIVVTQKKNALNVKVKKVSGQTGFQIRYRLKGKKKWTVKSYNSKKTVTKTIKKLKAGKKYQVSARAIAGNKYKKFYSAWSKTVIKKVK